STTVSCWGEGEAVGAGTFVTAVALLPVSGDPQPAKKRARTVTGQRKPRRFKKLISPPICDSDLIQGFTALYYTSNNRAQEIYLLRPSINPFLKLVNYPPP